MKDDSFDCTLIAHLRIFLLFYRLLYCLILPENRLFFGIWKVVEIEPNNIRVRREEECFSYINRGDAWYELYVNTPERVKEFNEWYQAWLNAPQTRVIPTKPEWID